MTPDQLSALAQQSGATHFSPPPMRAVRGWSFTYEQLSAFADALAAQPAAQPVAYPVLPEPDLHALLSDCRGYLQSYAHAAIDADRASAAQPARAGGDALQQAVSDYLEAQDALDNWELQSINREPHDRVMRRRNDARRGLDAALAAAPQPAPASTVESVLHAFESKERGIPQAHIAAQLVTELRAALAQAEVSQPAPAEQHSSLLMRCRQALELCWHKSGVVQGLKPVEDLLIELSAHPFALRAEQPAGGAVPAKKLSIEEIKGEYANHEAQIGIWLTMWDRSGLSRSRAIRAALQEMHRLHFNCDTAAPAAVERDAPGKPVTFKQNMEDLQVWVEDEFMDELRLAGTIGKGRDGVFRFYPFANGVVMSERLLRAVNKRVNHLNTLGIGSSKEGGDGR